MEDDEFLTVMNRFSFSPSGAHQLSVERVELRRALAAFVRGSVDRPSQGYRLLKHLSLESLLFMMAFTSREQTRKHVSDFITKYRYVTPHLKGKDLIEMGYKPGPVFHSILEAVRDASLDGVTKTAEDERKLVSDLFPLGSRQVSGSAE